MCRLATGEGRGCQVEATASLAEGPAGSTFPREPRGCLTSVLPCPFLTHPRPRHTRQHARSTGHGARALLCEPDSKTSRLAVLRRDLRAPPRAKPVTAGPAPSRDPQWDGGRGTGTWASGADRALTRPIAATVQLSLRVCHVEMTVEAVSSQRGSGCVGSRLTPVLPRSPFRVAAGVLSPETQFRCPLFPKALRLPPPATRPSGLPHPARSVIAAGWFT